MQGLTLNEVVASFSLDGMWAPVASKHLPVKVRVPNSKASGLYLGQEARDSQIVKDVSDCSGCDNLDDCYADKIGYNIHDRFNGPRTFLRFDRGNYRALLYTLYSSGGLGNYVVKLNRYLDRKGVPTVVDSSNVDEVLERFEGAFVKDAEELVRDGDTLVAVTSDPSTLDQAPVVTVEYAVPTVEGTPKGLGGTEADEDAKPADSVESKSDGESAPIVEVKTTGVAPISKAEAIQASERAASKSAETEARAASGLPSKEASAVVELRQFISENKKGIVAGVGAVLVVSLLVRTLTGK